METIKEIKDALDLVQSQLTMKDVTIQAANDRISELEDDIESFGSDDPGSSYKICGEKVMIRVDNIAHETFFEKLEEFSKKCNIQELTNAIINLKSMSAR